MSTHKLNLHLLQSMLIAFSAIVFIAYMMEINRSDLSIPVVDALTYHNQAADALLGKENIQPYWQPPLFVYWLTLVYKTTGVNHLAGNYAQTLWFIITCLMTFEVGRRLMNIRAASLATIIACIYGPMLFYSGQLLPTGMATAILTASVLSFMWLAEDISIMRLMTCGLLIGIGSLTVPNILTLIAIPIGLLLRKGHIESQPVKYWRQAVIIIVTTCIVIAPVSLRNLIVSHQFVPISTNGGINFYLGNNPDSNATIALRPGSEWQKLGIQSSQDNLNDLSSPHRSLTKESLHYINTQPLDFISETLRKTYHLFNAREIPRNTDIYVARDFSSLLKLLAWRCPYFSFPAGILIPLAFLGLSTLNRKNINLIIIATAIAVYSLSIIIFFPTSRYQAPLYPMLILLAATGAISLYGSLKGPRQSLVIKILLLTAFAIIVNLPASYPSDRRNFRAEMYSNIGWWHQQNGDLTTALDCYLKAADLDPNFADTFHYLGNIALDMNMLDKAIPWYLRAIELRSDDYTAMTRLGHIYCTLGRYEEGLPMVRQALTINPKSFFLHNDLGSALAVQGKLEDSLKEFQLCLEIDASSVNAMLNAGVVLFQLNRMKESASYFEQALILLPGNAMAHENLGMALYRLGQHDEALKHFDQAEKLNPFYKTEKAQSIRNTHIKHQ